MLGLYALLFLGLVAALCAGRTTEPPQKRELHGEVNLRLFVPVAAELVLTTWWHEHLIGMAAILQRPFPPWMTQLPAIPVQDLAPLYGHIDVRISEAAGILMLQEAALLTALVLLSRGRRLGVRGSIVMAIGVAALALGALRAHGILSSDIYAYIADGVLGLQAYHPRNALFTSGLSSIPKLWGNPPLPCAYGPTWLFPASLLMHGVHNLSAGVLRFRAAGIASILAVMACLIRGRASLPVILTFSLNPAIWMQYGADGHNELWPIALILCGRLYADRPLIASLFGGLAGAAKLPFLVACVLTGANRRSLRERLLIAAGSVAVALLVSAAFGGRPYLDALKAVQRSYPTATDPQSLGVHVMALAGALAALMGAILLRRTAWPAAFSFMGIGYGVFPWYGVWGLVYATLGDGAELLLCALPVSAFVTATTYSVTPLWLPLMLGVTVAACWYAYRLVRRRLMERVQKPSPLALVGADTM